MRFNFANMHPTTDASKRAGADARVSGEVIRPQYEESA